MVFSLVSREAEQPSRARILQSPIPQSTPPVPAHYVLFEPKKGSERQLMSESLEGTK